MSSLKKQAVHAAFWSFSERFGQQGIQFVISIILARLLEPDDFGVLAMIMIFSALARSVVDSGFGTALIQKQDTNHTDESTVFWFNLVAGLVMAGVLSSIAPLIASFYDVPILKPVTRVFSINLIINSFGIVQDSLLIKELAFRKRMKVSLSSIFISGVAGIALAFRGYGVWALVAQTLLMSLMRTVGLWIVHPWRPAYVFSRASLSRLWKFGSNLLFSGLLNTFFDNIYLVVIGKIYSPVELGFYHRSKRLILLTSRSLSQVVAQVNYPLLSKMQGDPERMRRAFKKVEQTTMLAIMPAMVGLAVVAPDFIYLLLGEKWMPCVPYLQILCVLGIFFPLHVLNLNVIAAVGRSDIYFKLELVKKTLTTISILITYRYDVMTMLWGQVVCSSLSLIWNTLYVHKFMQYGLVKQLRSIWRVALASGVMAAFVWGSGQVVNCPVALEFFLQVAGGAIFFILMEWGLKDPVFMEGLAFAAGRIRRRKNDAA